MSLPVSCIPISERKAEFYNLSERYTQDHVRQFWLQVIFSCCDGNITFEPRLRINSANSAFTFVQCGTNKYIAKFQIGNTSDNITVDNINGTIINDTLGYDQTRWARPHFMEYIDGCVTTLETNRGQMFFHLDRILSQPSKPPNSAGSFAAKLSLNRAVGSPTSLAEYIRRDNTVAVNRMLSDFFAALYSLGYYTGFTHNDATLYNVLVDTTGKYITMIDYGRAVMCEELLDPEYLKSVIDFEAEKMGETIPSDTNYTNYIYQATQNNPYRMIELQRAAVGVDPSLQCVRFLFMFDVMAITLGVLRQRCFYNLHKYKYFSYQNTTTRSQQLGQILIVPGIYNVPDSVKRDLGALLPGVLWMTLLASFLWETEPDASEYIQLLSENTHIPMLRVNLSVLTAKKIIHSDFQFVSFRDPEAFIEYMLTRSTEIASITKSLNERSQAGGNTPSPTKTPRATNPTKHNTTQITNPTKAKTVNPTVRRADNTTFTKEISAYYNNTSQNKLRF